MDNIRFNSFSIYHLRTKHLVLQKKLYLILYLNKLIVYIQSWRYYENKMLKCFINNLQRDEKFVIFFIYSVFFIIITLYLKLKYLKLKKMF